MCDYVASGASSVISGMETPESLDLRKRNTPAGSTTPGDSSMGTQALVEAAPKQLYQVCAVPRLTDCVDWCVCVQVLETKDTSALGGLMGSTHKYVVPSMDKGTGAKLVQKQQVEGVQVTMLRAMRAACCVLCVLCVLRAMRAAWWLSPACLSDRFGSERDGRPRR